MIAAICVVVAAAGGLAAGFIFGLKKADRDYANLIDGWSDLCAKRLGEAEEAKQTNARLKARLDKIADVALGNIPE